MRRFDVWIALYAAVLFMREVHYFEKIAKESLKEKVKRDYAKTD